MRFIVDMCTHPMFVLILFWLGVLAFLVWGSWRHGCRIEELEKATQGLNTAVQRHENSVDTLRERQRVAKDESDHSVSRRFRAKVQSLANSRGLLIRTDVARSSLLTLLNKGELQGVTVSPPAYPPVWSIDGEGRLTLLTSLTFVEYTKVRSNWDDPGIIPKLVFQGKSDTGEPLVLTFSTLHINSVVPLEDKVSPLPSSVLCDLYFNWCSIDVKPGEPDENDTRGDEDD